MNPVEQIADRMPHRLVRPASVTCGVFGTIGAAALFAAVVFGSIVWTAVGLGAFVVAALLWHLVAYASEIGRLPSLSDV